MSRGGLTLEQNERVREIVRKVLQDDFDGNQSALAPRLGITQPALSSFLSGRTGTSYGMVERLGKLTKAPEWQILGKVPPRAPARPAREVAAELARDFGVSERAIADVLAAPVTAQTSAWPVLAWTDAMRRRELDLMAPPAPSPPADEARTSKSEVRVRRQKVRG